MLKEKSNERMKKQKPTAKNDKEKVKIKKNEEKLKSKLTKANTNQKIIQIVESFIQGAHNKMTPDRDEIVQDKHLLNRLIMEELVMETAKLKTSSTTETIPLEKLLYIFNIMEMNIGGGDRHSLLTDEDSKSKQQTERVLGAADACLVCLYIMTSPNMPKRIYLENVIDKVVSCVNYQLRNIIFPAFNGTYRLDNKKIEGGKKKITQVPKVTKVLYDKTSELINLLSELLNIQVLPVTLVLRISSMCVSSFCVEDIKELQVACLKLITTIFIHYEKHRRLILDNILSSMASLPRTKCILLTYNVETEGNIHVLTVLVLQLIQCVVVFPDNLIKEICQSINLKKVNKEALICNKYENAINTAGTFLTTFLNKCIDKSEDTHYKPLFEIVIQDLLTTANKPEWPASELLLMLLGRILVKKITDKEIEASLRVLSLDYLAVLVTRLRKNDILLQEKMNAIDEMVKEIKNVDKKQQAKVDSEEEKIQILQDVLLNFLAENEKNNETLQYARHFCIAQWYNDITNTKDKKMSKANTKNEEVPTGVIDGACVNESKTTFNRPEMAQKYSALKERKKLLIDKIETPESNGRINITYDAAELITQYLVSKRCFSQNFHQYFKAILIVLNETSTVVRAKALKCLFKIIEADPSLLALNDVQMAVNYSFLDQAPLVRETAVDLIGNFVLDRPKLFDKYYELLCARILDTSASVRKSVIKILKDVCIKCPDFPKVPEICVKMIRRVNDEGSVGMSVVRVFQNMWFTPSKNTSLLQTVVNITDVVAASKDVDLEWFEQLLFNLLKPKEDKNDSKKIQTEPPEALLVACTQIIDCLIENFQKLKETHNVNSGSSQGLLSHSTTLYLFAKIRPQLLVKHIHMLTPLLNLKYFSKEDVQIINNAARILALVVPLIQNPDQAFWVQLEDLCIKLIFQHDRLVVASCFSCLKSIINKVTRNFKLIRDCFKKYYNYLVHVKLWITSEAEKNVLDDIKCRQYFKRALFTVGLLLRHFDFKDREVIGELPENIRDEVFEVFLFFLGQNCEDIQANAVKAVGSMCTKHYEFLLEKDLKAFYLHVLTSNDVSLALKSDVLTNIEMYLLEEDHRMMQQDLEWEKHSKLEDLKTLDDASSGMASTIIQQYLKEILESYLHSNIQVRKPALRVVQLILQQGLVHPVQTVPYLICMSTDCEKIVSHSSEKQLLELEKKYPGFIYTKSLLGIKLSYNLQKILQQGTIIRGFQLKDDVEYPIAFNGYFYSILRNSRQQRRALTLNMLKQFDEEHSSLSYMLYIADNIAYFPYLVQDELLFIIHHIDLMISYSGMNLLQSFREGLINAEVGNQQLESSPDSDVPVKISALDEDDDKEELLARLPEDTSHLQACLTAAQSCLLLLMLKQHLKDTYGLNDGKVRQYSPCDLAKIHEKPIHRKSNTHFNPKATINKLQEGSPPRHLDEEGRKNLINQYVEFKLLMLKLDGDDNDENENRKVLQSLNSSINTDKSISSVPGSILRKFGKINQQQTSSGKKRKPEKYQVPKKDKKAKQRKKKQKLDCSSNEDTDSDFVP